MGKILEFLHIESETQPKDVLDAERLLEGMQNIYSNASDSNKKDNFGNLLAEMTKTFIEYLNGDKSKEIIEVQEEKELEEIESVENEANESNEAKPKEESDTKKNKDKKQDDKPKFKKGDKVEVLRDRPSSANIMKGDILTVEDYDGKYEVALRDNQGNRWYVMPNDIRLIEEKKEPLLFMLGDKFKVPPEDSNNIYTIAEINDKMVKVKWDNKEVEYLIEEANNLFKDGTFVLIKQEEKLPFKDFDKFRVLNNNKITYSIQNVFPDSIVYTYKIKDEAFVSQIPLKEAIDNFKTGYYYLVNENETDLFKIGDKFKQNNDTRIYTIENINYGENLVTMSFTSEKGRGEIDYDENLANFRSKWQRGVYKKIEDNIPKSTPSKSSKSKILSAEQKQRIKDIKLEIKGLELIEDDEDAAILIKELEEEINVIKSS
jgi:hypothetical protein